MRFAGPFIAAALLAMGFYAVLDMAMPGLHLDLGTVAMPTRGYFVYFALVAAFGGPAVVLLTLGFQRALPPKVVAQAIDGLGSPRLLGWLVALGVLTPLAVASAVLRFGPLTDDEAAYRFSAQLLASGRLWAPSPPMKLFYDTAFLVNDGRMFSQYFLGWPALLAAGVKAWVPWLVNPVLNGLTVFAVYRVGCRWWGPRWAAVAGALVLISPMAEVLAATQMSHTAALFALAWLAYFCARAEGETSAWNDFAVAATFCLGFWVRPQVALGAGAPLLVYWLTRARWSWLRLGRFLVVAVPAAAGFLAVNKVYSGSFFTPPYNAYLAYAEANGFRFAPFSAAGIAEMKVTTNYALQPPWVVLGNHALNVFRLNLDLFAWPASLLFVALARGARVRWLWGSVGGYFVTHLLVTDGGVDTIGPPHFFELLLPVALLSTEGLRWLHAWTRERAPGLPLALLLALVTVELTLVLPPRLLFLARAAGDIMAPQEAARELPENSVVFAARPVAPNCRTRPGRHFVFFHPGSTPDHDDPVLWVNHVSVARDQEFLRSLGRSRGFVLAYDAQCQPRFVALEDATDKRFPPSVQERPGDFTDPARTTPHPAGD